MPVARYRTDYRNQVHQLLVTLSRNYYVGKDGLLKYQKKPLPYDLRTVNKSKKTRLVHFILRDHFSGIYYAEMCTHDDMINLGRFLYTAWSEKEGYEFCGVPENLFVPQIIMDRWPTILDLLDDYGIQALKPKSGFQAGTITAKYWQHAVVDHAIIVDRGGMTSNYNFNWLRSQNLEICIDEANGKAEGTKITKLEKWRQSETKLLVPTDEIDFQRRFEKQDAT